MTSRIFCAVDTNNLDSAKKLGAALHGHVAGLKLGLEFFSALGPDGYRAIASGRMPIFLDLKLHDIPNTVAGALEALLPLAPRFITLHAAGGPAMMKAAAETVRKAGTARPHLLAVTVLTSLSSPDLKMIGQDAEPISQVLRLARLAKECGMDGIVCSPAEVALARETLGPDMTLMVPGIRSAGSAVGDQKRVMTPKDAVDAGASYIVVGRPITESADPAAMAQRINAECG